MVSLPLGESPGITNPINEITSLPRTQYGPCRLRCTPARTSCSNALRISARCFWTPRSGGTKRKRPSRGVWTRAKGVWTWIRVDWRHDARCGFWGLCKPGAGAKPDGAEKARLPPRRPHRGECPQFRRAAVGTSRPGATAAGGRVGYAPGGRGAADAGRLKDPRNRWAGVFEGEFSVAVESLGGNGHTEGAQDQAAKHTACRGRARASQGGPHEPRTSQLFHPGGHTAHEHRWYMRCLEGQL